MNYYVFFLAVYVLSAQCFNVENLDREYYLISNKKVFSPAEYSERVAKGETPKINIEFKPVEVKRETNKYVSLLESLDKLQNLASRELVHSDSNNKIILVPFKSIKLINDDGEVNVGYYKGSYVKKGRIIQSYTGGDACDICKGKRWSSTVHYQPDLSEMELSGPVESSTCSYTFSVKGNELTNEEKYVVLDVVPVENKDPEAEKDQSTEENSQESAQACANNVCKNSFPIKEYSIITESISAQEKKEEKKGAEQPLEKTEHSPGPEKEDL
ncbi:uncharacterized protein NEMAJ01_0183 [Nematocida major]|uniref:uncharacterized protein n=1 Tax=Nematocida major TaxID=1912982 RepID=UPI002008AE02|nr:uncharacterized protein NEMAJ01_0183 [Nematocida major]KAH9385287.1 hypothetical protein NEMAJ01_0183 [Nematocida major]